MKLSLAFFFATVVGAANSRLMGATMAGDSTTSNNTGPRTQRKLQPINIVGDGFDVEEDGRQVHAQPDNNDRDFHVMTFTLGPGKVIQAKSSPKKQEIEISLLGTLKKNELSDDDRAFLEDVANSLEGDDTMDTYSVDTTPSQAARMSHLLAEWPTGLDIDYIFDVEAEMDRIANNEPAGGRRNAPDDAPNVPDDDGLRRRDLMESATTSTSGGGDEIVHDEETGRRRLAYTSLCSSVHTFVEATHDDFWYNRWDDRTTYFAYLSMHASGPCSDGTYFWINGSWVCTEPDHDSNIEYAYGDCFGRCGAGCGSGTQFTRDCLDHDSCVRFGHDLASLWCDDEFSYTVDDALFAPNCL